MSEKLGSVGEVVLFNRVDLVSGSDGFDFGCGPKSLSEGVAEEDDCPVAHFPALSSHIFESFQVISVRRARFVSLPAPLSTELSSFHFRDWWLWVYERSYASTSYMSQHTAPRK